MIPGIQTVTRKQQNLNNIILKLNCSLKFNKCFNPIYRIEKI